MDREYTVVGYVRVSTENQIENYSIKQQIDRLTAYCKAKDWCLKKVYTDGGYSGGNTNRPQLKEMLQDLKTSKVDAVIVYKLDRLSRSQKDTLTLIEDEFISNNIDFISINENFDTSTPFGRAMIGILSVFAQLEKDQIVERFTMGRIGRSKSGLYHGGASIPLGYVYENGVLVVDEYEADKVKQLYLMFLEGKSLNSIASYMENAFKNPWSANKVRYILKNPLYIGKIRFANFEYQGKHQPIIEEKTFTEVQNILNSASRENSKNASQKTPFRAGFLLSSMIYCGNCNARYSASHGYYKCYSRSKCCKKFIIDPSCKNKNWGISQLDDVVLTGVYEVIGDLCGEIELRAKNTKPEVIDFKKIDARIATIEKQISNLVDLYQLGNIPMDMISQKIDVLHKEKTTLQDRLQKKSQTTEKAKEDSSVLEKFKTNFQSVDVDTKRFLVGLLIEKIVIYDQTVEIIWRI